MEDFAQSGSRVADEKKDEKNATSGNAYVGPKGLLSPLSKGPFQFSQLGRFKEFDAAGYGENTGGVDVLAGYFAKPFLHGNPVFLRNPFSVPIAGFRAQEPPAGLDERPVQTAGELLKIIDFWLHKNKEEKDVDFPMVKKYGVY